MRNSLTSSIALAILGSASLTFAQTDEIVITAKGEQTISDVLATTHVFTVEQIEAAQVKDLTGLLNRLTGVNVTDSGGRGSQTSVFIRGAANSQIIVLIDGVRVGSATLGVTAINSYPVEAIERIEVLKGPFSGLYGADAAGGVIQIFTKKGGQGGSAVSATIGSDSLRELGVSFNAGDERNSFHVSAHSEASDGIDRTSILSGGNDDKDGYEEVAVSLGGKMSFGDSTVAKLSVLGTDNTVDFDNTFGSDPGSMTDTKTLSAALNITTEFNDLVRWTNTLGINEDETQTFSDFPSEFVTKRDSLGTELALSLGQNSLLTIGADYYQEDIESSNNYPVTERDNTGLFAQLSSGIGKLGLVGSLRYDDNSAYGSTTNGSLAVDYSFNDNLRVVLSAGSAFVAPSFNFLYFPSFGNPEVQPEESDSVELSLVGASNEINWRVSLYQTDFENLLASDPATFTATNIGAAEIEGIEFEMNTQWAEWDWTVRADVLSAQNKTTGVELDGRAERSVNLTASRNFGALDLRFDMHAESGRFDNSGTELPSYGLFDVSARYQINEQLALLANVDNVFDKDYTVNLIGPNNRYNTEGRQAQLTVKYSF